MSRSANLISRFTELSEKKGKKYANPVKGNGPGNPYHDLSGQFVAADDATIAAKYTDSLKKSGEPSRLQIKGWKKDKDSGKMEPKIGLPTSAGGPNVCGRTARKQGLDIRCSDGKVMGGKAKLKAKAQKVKAQRAKEGR